MNRRQNFIVWCLFRFHLLILRCSGGFDHLTHRFVRDQVGQNQALLEDWNLQATTTVPMPALILVSPHPFSRSSIAPPIPRHSESLPLPKSAIFADDSVIAVVIWQIHHEARELFSVKVRASGAPSSSCQYVACHAPYRCPNPIATEIFAGLQGLRSTNLDELFLHVSLRMNWLKWETWDFARLIRWGLGFLSGPARVAV